MERFVAIRGAAVPFLECDIDTDQISPGTELLRSVDDGYDRWAQTLFAQHRYRQDGSPNPNYILNKAPWSKAVILLAGRNFGCGSSREWAVKALRGFGFRSIIAPSFGEIFYGNCFRHGILPVVLAEEQIARLAAQVIESGGTENVSVDLAAQKIIGPEGIALTFDTPELFRRMLLHGLDEVEVTLSFEAEIGRFRELDAAKRPWAYLSRRARGDALNDNTDLARS
ncbi:3-isopropylmalate dehydratase small subunit [Bradyrhizobium sp. BR 10261]|uniref:3-isopropylmalate dehydratase small subunit n=1 Tax=Bradyrhizobium sp. BR 10261 TaxID=2749992 RepID=UPI001C6517C4|nr:3-isopropylmalate dehydratase small subunit [Bradyrhizobium sp. BR 10261]MBW7967148.1 3-isopropylmalate dehydratase small subunit [Bradyrhizobium sp. BR 10261]